MSEMNIKNFLDTTRHYLLGMASASQSPLDTQPVYQAC